MANSLAVKREQTIPAPTQGSKYQIRKDGRPYAGWDDPALTPGKETLKSMKAAGYRLYIDGKLQR